ncbi:MAG: hypothetical protein F9K44_08425 [Hyphomicrobiaceae bacterium]|nr:MAG: hypothetical protein F9K44_08425 [Hyphomicrobiaceae bacterium]
MPMAREVITDWQKRHEQLFGQHTVQLSHRLHESDLFSDAALARLIERTPREHYHVNTMDPATHDPRTRREGQIKDLKGEQVLEAVRTGTIWILLQNPGHHDARYAELLSSIYGEWEQRVPGFKSFKQKMTILISSPKVHVYYHADIPGQSLWQVRGRKRVWVYPNRTPFLPQEGIERIVLNEAHEISLNYNGWFDDYAEVIDLEPGRMVHWPLNCPHRIVNHDCVNVSFTTEHWTNALRSAHAINYANGVLRRVLGLKNLSQTSTGASFYSKLLLAAAYKYSGMQKKREAGFTIDFAVDPGAPHGVRDIPAFELRK